MGPESTRREVVSFVRSGLSDVSISRTNLTWGIPFPVTKSTSSTSGSMRWRITLPALGYGSDDEEKFKKFWPADLHLIGKRSAGSIVFTGRRSSWLGIATPRSVRANGWLLFDQGKMSKSRGILCRAQTVQKCWERMREVFSAARDSVRAGWKFFF